MAGHGDPVRLACCTSRIAVRRGARPGSPPRASATRLTLGTHRRASAACGLCVPLYSYAHGSRSRKSCHDRTGVAAFEGRRCRPLTPATHNRAAATGLTPIRAAQGRASPARDLSTSELWSEGLPGEAYFCQPNRLAEVVFFGLQGDRYVYFPRGPRSDPVLPSSKPTSCNCARYAPAHESYLRIRTCAHAAM